MSHEDTTDDELAKLFGPNWHEDATDDEHAKWFGPNWKAAKTVLQQAIDLTQEQAEKIADCAPGPNFDLDLEVAHEAVSQAGLVDWSTTWDACDEAADHVWSRGGAFWDAHDAFCGALTAAIAGDCVPETTHRDLMRPWLTVFTAFAYDTEEIA
ncbi:hypothetical protein SAMN05216483_6785 [Streptomyces sp. 2131.1]|uniref:hypothetical protein n=1 Tax=Streptomyces sp. 2131.1 TaxID=1855346 RepID=UPI000897C34C|nr:hypothetical protein [Streptomyces sp. 2131.1]SEE85045.1 hypothetical protein SAMN05216483_6785 [Streptomyces sp. 2131.1]